MEDSFIEERLAAATAIPASQRSPEVAAFIESCQLQQELSDEGPCSTLQQRNLANLKVTRCNFLHPAGALLYRPAVRDAALDRLLSAARIPDLEMPAGVIGKCIMKLVSSDFSAETLVLVGAAAIAIGRWQAHRTRLLPVYNSIVERMQRPAVAARLQEELEQLQAGLSHSLLTHKQLIALFVGYAVMEAGSLLSSGDTSMDADIRMAVRVAAERLPYIVPDHLGHCFHSILAHEWHNRCTGPETVAQVLQCVHRLLGLLEQAQHKGSDLCIAQCGYQLVNCSQGYRIWGCEIQDIQEISSVGGSSSVEGEGLLPPSKFLGWLQQATQAHARCQAVLPLQWTLELEERRKYSMKYVPWLQRQQQEGDLWQQAEPQQAQAEAVAMHRKFLMPPGDSHLCSGCGEIHSHMQLCGGCKQAKYCSRQCQKAHWPHHKPFCKAQQEAQPRSK